MRRVTKETEGKCVAIRPTMLLGPYRQIRLLGSVRNLVHCPVTRNQTTSVCLELCLLADVPGTREPLFFMNVSPHCAPSKNRGDLG